MVKKMNIENNFDFWRDYTVIYKKILKMVNLF